jgi:hypothetical protein
MPRTRHLSFYRESQVQGLAGQAGRWIMIGWLKPHHRSLLKALFKYCSSGFNVPEEELLRVHEKCTQKIKVSHFPF